MPRIAPIEPADRSPAQQKFYDDIVATRGKIGGPFLAWMHSAELADRAQALGAFCRFHSSLPPRLSELAILILGAHWQAAYEWNTHIAHALKAGISPEVVEALRTGQIPASLPPDAQAVYDFATELLRNRRVTDATYARATALIGERGVVDLVGIMGYYTLISMTCVAFEVEPGPGPANPFA